MGLLDALIFGVRDILFGTTPLVRRSRVAFTGSGVTVADDPTNDRTLVTVAGGGSTTMGGDVSGSSVACTVTKVNGVTPPGGVAGLTDVNPPIVGVPGGTLDIDWSLGDVFNITLTGGADVLTMSHVGVKRKLVIVHVTGAGGSLAITPGGGVGVKWPGGVAPTQTPSGDDTYTFVFDGTDVRATSLQAFA